MELRPYQKEAVNAIENEWAEGRRKTLLTLPTGCHALGQKVLRANGEPVKVEDIKVGDRLLGEDGTSRNVLAVHTGTTKLYEIVPVKGDPFTVTHDHLLTLERTNCKGNARYQSQQGGVRIDVTVDEWLQWSKTKKHIYKLVRSGCIGSFYGKEYASGPIDPYFLGVLLGDGGLKYGINVTTMDLEIEEYLHQMAHEYGMFLKTEPAGKATTYRFTGGGTGREGSLLHRELKELGLAGCGSGEKFVPECYLYARRGIREKVIAGLIDTDGHKAFGGYDFISKSERLSRDLAYMCRSIGLAAYVKECQKSAGEFTGTYYRVSISGDCQKIPCRVTKKIAPERRQKKSVLRTGFTVRNAGVGPYVGFTVDRDNRYLLDDFTITHNCGKTIVFSSVINNRVKAGERCLVLAHREELLQQAADKMRSAFGIESVLEKASSTGIGSMFPVTVGSVQTLCRSSRLSRFAPDEFGTVVVDEAHHIMSDSYQTVMQHFDGAKVLGVTATPDRGDKKNLANYFDSLAYEYNLRQAIAEGYLCKISAELLPLSIDLTEAHKVAGDYSADDIGDALDPYIDQIADIMAVKCRDHKTVVFLPLIRTSLKMRDALADRGMRVAEVNGQSPDRKEILEDFDAGRYDVLCNSMLLTEGWDCPSVDCLVILRPTKIRALYQQMVGRGLRLYPGKDHLLLLDFLWNTTKHDLCSPARLFADKDAIAEKIEEALKDGAEDLMEAEEAAVKADREASLARALKDLSGNTKKLIDPLRWSYQLGFDLEDYEPVFAWEEAPPSGKQLDAIARYGMDASSITCRGQACALLDQLIGRSKAKLATPKQVSILLKKGFAGAGSWSFKQASDMISVIAANHWQAPRWVGDPALYVPKHEIVTASEYGW